MSAWTQSLTIASSFNETARLPYCKVKFKVVVAPVFAVALLLCAGCPLAVTVTVYVPTGIQLEL